LSSYHLPSELHPSLRRAECVGVFVRLTLRRGIDRTRTGETSTIAAKRDTSFNPGKELSQSLVESNTENNPNRKTDEEAAVGLDPESQPPAPMPSEPFAD
jgi:hypothetical protein